MRFLFLIILTCLVFFSCISQDTAEQKKELHENSHQNNDVEPGETVSSSDKDDTASIDSEKTFLSTIEEQTVGGNSPSDTIKIGTTLQSAIESTIKTLPAQYKPLLKNEVPVTLTTHDNTIDIIWFFCIPSESPIKDITELQEQRRLEHDTAEVMLTVFPVFHNTTDDTISRPVPIFEKLAVVGNISIIQSLEKIEIQDVPVVEIGLLNLQTRESVRSYFFSCRNLKNIEVAEFEKSPAATHIIVDSNGDGKKEILEFLSIFEANVGYETFVNRWFFGTSGFKNQDTVPMVRTLNRFLDQIKLEILQKSPEEQLPEKLSTIFTPDSNGLDSFDDFSMDNQDLFISNITFPVFRENPFSYPNKRKITVPFRITYNEEFPLIFQVTLELSMHFFDEDPYSIVSSPQN